MLLRQGPDLVVVDAAVGTQAVGHHVVVFARKVRGGAVGQVSALVQAHSQHRVAGLAQSLIHGKVGLGAGVGLYVGKARAKELLGPLNGDIFHHVHALTAAVVPVGGVALRIFVGQDAACGGEDRRTDNVFRGDQFDILLLAVEFRPDSLSDLRVGGREKVHHLIDHKSSSFFI